MFVSNTKLGWFIWWELQLQSTLLPWLVAMMLIYKRYCESFCISHLFVYKSINCRILLFRCWCSPGSGSGHGPRPGLFSCAPSSSSSNPNKKRCIQIWPTAFCALAQIVLTAFLLLFTSEFMKTWVDSTEDPLLSVHWVFIADNQSINLTVHQPLVVQIKTFFF